MKKKFILLILMVSALFVTLTFSSCSVLRSVKYDGPYSEVNGAYAAVDDLGRELVMDSEKPQTEKIVGIFYFLWQGEHGTAGPYDNEKIVSSNPDAVLSEDNWLASGGGAVGAHHFWGRTPFRLLYIKDKLGKRKHVRCLLMQTLILF